MALPKSRPFKHPKTGIYWFRMRVPANVADRVGRTEVTRTLGTKDPAEAKRLYAEVRAEIETQWNNLRRDRRSLTEREAHGMAAVFYEKWLALNRDNPSEEFVWHPELFPLLWTGRRLPEVEPKGKQPGSKPIENIFLDSM